MRRHLRVSPSMVVAVLALFAALGGTGYAASQDNSSDTTLFHTLAKTATVTNAKHLGGAPATAYQRAAKIMFATVNTGTSPTIARGRGAVGVTNLDPTGPGGEYAVAFDRPVTNCTWVATAGPGNASPADAVLAVVRGVASHSNQVMVILYTNFSDNEFIGQGFHLMVMCP